MKAAFSKIGLGALIATAIHVASAAPTASTTQAGTGNTAYTEQNGIDPTATASATIIQVGNNNFAGDPATQTPGILQRNITLYSPANALIYQIGDDHAAAIVQDGTSFPVNAEIDQSGSHNRATIAQTIMTYSDGMLRQDGVNNYAALTQTGIADHNFVGKQNGSDNIMLVRENDATYTTSTLTQTGSQNTAYTSEDHTLGGFIIEQTGTLNWIDSSMTGDVRNVIQQTGTGNVATTSQVEGNNKVSEIVQTGDNNFASLSQVLNDNFSQIRQIGNSNQATMTQTSTGPGINNTAYITQVGNGFVANTTQTGEGNNSGIYQH